MAGALASGQQVGGERTAAVLPTAGAITALTGLRFAAALLVVVSHFPSLVPVAGLEHGLVQQGAAGVTIFFVLSGFVLTYRYAETFSTGARGAFTFMRSRLARIVPMAVVAMLITTAVVYAVTSDAETRTARSWIVNVLLLQAWVPTNEMAIWNGPAWSVSAELFFYAMFPLVTWLVVSRLSPKHLVPAAIACFVIEALLFIGMAVVVERRFTDKTTADIDLMLQRFKSFPPLRIWEFLLGCLLGSAYLADRRGSRTPLRFLRRQGTRQWIIVGVSLVLAALVVLPAIVDEPQRGLASRLLAPGLYVTYTPLAVLLVAAIAWGPTRVSRSFDHPWMQRLGDASYAFYLLQGALIAVVFEWSGAPSPPGFWFVLPLVVLLVPLSLACETWIERPARALLRPRPAPAAAPDLSPEPRHGAEPVRP